MKKESVLTSTLYLDFVVTFLFSVISWLFPYATYGSVVAFSESDSPTLLSAFSNLSVMYVLIGLSCFIAAKTRSAQRIWFSYLMIFRHLWVGAIGFKDAGADWVVGNPVPDIVIHSLFVMAYATGIYFSCAAAKNLTKPQN